MNNENKNEQKLRPKKSFYLTAAVGILAVVASIVSLRLATGKVQKDLTKFASEQSFTLSTDKVQNEVTDVPDTRDFSLDDETEEETTEKATEEKTTEKKTEEKTTEESSSKVQNAAKIENPSYVLPLEAAVVKEYSAETPIFNKTMGDFRTHSGVDFEGNEGDEVVAVGNGIVSRVSVDSLWGYVIEIDHGDFTARYIGLSQDNAVGINDEVKIGQKLGVLSSIPAEKEDGAHLHFEVLKDGKYVEPVSALGLPQ